MGLSVDNVIKTTEEGYHQMNKASRIGSSLIIGTEVWRILESGSTPQLRSFSSEP